MRKHAILSASSAHRWLECTPSARLEEQIEDQGSSYAAEGTVAHTLAELKIRRDVLRCILPEDYAEAYARIASQVDEEMEEMTELYCDIIAEKWNAARALTPDAQLLIEQRLDFSKWVPEGFGTGDAVIISVGKIEVVDFKYGKGVQVWADENPQARLYALGAAEAFGDLYDITEVSSTICQPRLEHISTETLAIEELYQWADDIVAPKAQEAYLGVGEFHAGSWCKFCKIRYTCRARAEAALQIAKFDFQLPPTLGDEEIPEILNMLDKAEAWLKDIREYAYNKALAGTRWPGWKLVEGRSNRKYADEKLAAKVLKKAGLKDAQIYNKKLAGITDMTKTVKKELGTTLEEVLGEILVKPTGAPTLVPAADKRPEINGAVNDFMEE